MANNNVSYAFCTGGKSSDGLQAYSLIEGVVQLPGAFGGNVVAQGYIQPVLSSTTSQQPTAIPGGGGTSASVGATQQFTNNAIAMPAVPGGGLSLNWILQVNYTTGALSVKAGTAATTGTQVTPTPDANNVAIFTHTITNGDTIPWMRAPTLPDMWP